MLVDKIKKECGNLFFYGITPPKFVTDSTKIAEIAQRQINRLTSLNLDRLFFDDLQDKP